MRRTCRGVGLVGIHKRQNITVAFFHQGGQHNFIGGETVIRNIDFRCGNGGTIGQALDGDGFQVLEIDVAVVALQEQ